MSDMVTGQVSAKQQPEFKQVLRRAYSKWFTVTGLVNVWL